MTLNPSRPVMLVLTLTGLVWVGGPALAEGGATGGDDTTGQTGTTTNDATGNTTTNTQNGATNGTTGNTGTDNSATTNGGMTNDNTTGNTANGAYGNNTGTTNGTPPQTGNAAAPNGTTNDTTGTQSTDLNRGMTGGTLNGGIGVNGGVNGGMNGQSFTWTPQYRNRVDYWLRANGYNQYGDPQGRVYAGGNPLFNEQTGQTMDRYDYILQNHPELRGYVTTGFGWTPQQQQRLDAWARANRFNQYGDPTGTSYRNGGPLFNGTNGRQVSRYDYLLARHPDLAAYISMQPLTDQDRARIDQWVAQNHCNEFGEPNTTNYSSGSPLWTSNGQPIDRYDYILARHPELVGQLGIGGYDANGGMQAGVGVNGGTYGGGLNGGVNAGANTGVTLNNGSNATTGANAGMNTNGGVNGGLNGGVNGGMNNDANGGLTGGNGSNLNGGASADVNANATTNGATDNNGDVQRGVNMNNGSNLPSTVNGSVNGQNATVSNAGGDNPNGNNGGMAMDANTNVNGSQNTQNGMSNQAGMGTQTGTLDANGNCVCSNDTGANRGVGDQGDYNTRGPIGTPIANQAGAANSTMVSLNGHQILDFRAGAGGYSPQQRHDLFHQRLQNALGNGDMRSAHVSLRQISGEPVIFLNGQQLVTVTAQDARAYGLSQTALARRWSQNLRNALMSSGQ